jgi:hypothetical protein
MPDTLAAPDAGLSTEVRLMAVLELAERAAAVLRALADLTGPAAAAALHSDGTRAEILADARQACFESLAADLAAIGTLRDSTPVAVLAKAVRERAARAPGGPMPAGPISWPRPPHPNRPPCKPGTRQAGEANAVRPDAVPVRGVRQ